MVYELSMKGNNECCLPTYKVICDRSHSLMCKNDIYNSKISYGCYQNHSCEENAPYDLTPPWKDVHVVARISVGNVGKEDKKCIRVD